MAMALPSKWVCVCATVLVVMFVGVAATVRNDEISGLTRYIHAYLYSCMPVFCKQLSLDSLILLACAYAKQSILFFTVFSFHLFFLATLILQFFFSFQTQNFTCIISLPVSFHDYFCFVLEFFSFFFLKKSYVMLLCCAS